jgi:hypothetical protein
MKVSILDDYFDTLRTLPTVKLGDRSTRTRRRSAC